MNKEEMIEEIKKMTVVELADLVKAIEEEFGIEISDSDAEKIVTVGDVVKYIKECQ